MQTLSNVANPMGLEWRSTGSDRVHAMCRQATGAKLSNWWRGRQKTESDNWVVFGRVEPDLTGRLVASATSFDHIKYVDSIEEGRLHVEAIWALEQSSAGGK